MWLGDVGETETSPRKPNVILNQVPMSESVVTESIVNTANLAPGSARNPMHAGGSDLRMLAQVEKWMAVIREISQEQQELRCDVQARGEGVMNSVSAKVASPYEIKISESDRVLNSPAPGGGYAFYVALIIGLLATTCGVAWFILYESALPFGLTSVSGLAGNRDLNPKAISSSLQQSSSSPAARTPDTQTSDRIQIHDTMVREMARSVPAKAPQNPTNVSALSAKPVSTAPLPRLASENSTVAPRRAALTGSTVKEARKLTPAPETRPTTIEGWTLREVVNGTAVIEGPNGVWKVTTGQAVPGGGSSGFYCSLGQSFGGRDDQGLNLDAIGAHAKRSHSRRASAPQASLLPRNEARRIAVNIDRCRSARRRCGLWPTVHCAAADRGIRST